MTGTKKNQISGKKVQSPLKGGTVPETSEIWTHICSCHNVFLLSSVLTLLVPACCLLCVL